jgi:hypothetical protein
VSEPPAERGLREKRRALLQVYLLPDLALCDISWLGGLPSLMGAVAPLRQQTLQPHPAGGAKRIRPDLALFDRRDTQHHTDNAAVRHHERGRMLVGRFPLRNGWTQTSFKGMSRPAPCRLIGPWQLCPIGQRWALIDPPKWKGSPSSAENGSG